jgi:DcuC family C4-dicarboxylate transporter
MTVFLGLLVVLLSIYAIYRRVDVRLSLLLGALVLGMLAGKPFAIVRKFLETFSNERFVVPICTALGFAYVLRLTGCDQHLVHLLVRPLCKVRLLLIPGTVLVGYLVNIPIRSQTSTAVMIGPAVISILLAARVPRTTIGAALLMGCSIGGELLNPAASDLRVVVVASEAAARAEKLPLEISGQHCVQRVLPLGLLGLAVAIATFWGLSRRSSSKTDQKADIQPEQGANEPSFQVHFVKAVVPLVPLILLYLFAPPLKLWEIPREWLESPNDNALPGRFESRLVGTAMLVGVAVATLVAPRSALQVAGAFFEGAGYAFTNIISLIVAANCLGEGINAIGLARLMGDSIGEIPALLLPAAGLMSLGFAALCGSGVAATQSLFGFFAVPALRSGLDPAHVGAVVALAAAAGRTMSPAASVVLMTAALTKTEPFSLIQRVAVPLLAAVAAMIVAAIVLAPGS